MSRPRRVDPNLVARAQAALGQATSLTELRVAQAVLLPAVARTTLEETVDLLGLSRASVPRLQQRFREGLEPRCFPRRRWGGWRRTLMALEEEMVFLAPWVEQARTAGMLVVSPLRAGLAEKLGRLVVMVLDRANSHKAKDPAVPENMSLQALSPYASQLNPQEHVWDELHEEEFPERVFNSMEVVIRQLQQDLPRPAADHLTLLSLTACPWIVSLNLSGN